MVIQVPDDAIDHFHFEVWTKEEYTLYWEWCEAWYHPDFNWETDLTPVGEDILAKAERIGPPPDWTRHADSPEDEVTTDSDGFLW